MESLRQSSGEKVKIIDDGNLTWGACVALVAMGVALMVWSVKFAPSSRWSVLPLLAGFGLVAVGGLSCRARLLKIKPFDNSYKKARDTYKAKDDKQDVPK
jgi:hypothetical protein